MVETLSETDLVRVSCEAAEHFADAYYTALDGARDTIKEYYVSTTTLPSGRTLPYVSYNGNVSTDPAEFQKIYEDMPFTYHEVQCLNALVLNPCLDPESAKTKKDAEHNMSITVQVGGSVRLNERNSGPLRGFSDNFVLVPNKEKLGGKGTGKMNQGRQWVIQTQNFRIVV